MMSSVNLSYLYPQVSIEEPRDIELLWNEEFEFKSLLKKKYISDFNIFNVESDQKERARLLDRYCTEYKLNKNYLERCYKTYGALNGETIFFEQSPDWFGYLVLGREFLAKQSKSRKFSFFTDFQVDYQKTFLDPDIVRIGLVTCRGGAKSWINMFCTVEDCTIHPGMEISVLGGSEKQSIGTYDYARAMALNEKSGIYNLIEDVTKEMITFKPRNVFGNIDKKDGFVSKIFNQAAAETSTRGPRASKILFDEVTQIKESVIMATLGQTITSPDIKISWSGTPDDPGHVSHTDWWCNPPTNATVIEIDENGINKQIQKPCHHWIYYYPQDPEMSWHLFHWNAYDCHVDKGGWITDKAIRALLATYKTHSKRRREIYGIWTAEEGNILKTEDIERAMRNFSVYNLPVQLSEYDGFAIAVDGARHRHYSTIVIIGFKNFEAHVLYANGWDEIKEPDLRRFIMRAVSDVRNKGGRNIHVVIEEADISATLIDNVRSECMDEHIRFHVSTFKHNKLNFVDHIIEYFETHKIKLPEQFIALVNELYSWHWSKNVDQKNRKLPEKGGDDYIDATMHGLMSDRVIFDAVNMKKGDVKLMSEGVRPEKKLADKMIALRRKNGGHGGFR